MEKLKTEDRSFVDMTQKQKLALKKNMDFDEEEDNDNSDEDIDDEIIRNDGDIENGSEMEGTVVSNKRKFNELTLKKKIMDFDEEEGDEDINDEIINNDGDIENGSEMQGTVVSNKRKFNDDEETSRKKRPDAKLYRPPTVKELNQFRETENLFHSNLFRLQIQELLKEVQVKTKYQSPCDQWLQDLKKTLQDIDDSPEIDLMDKKWMKKLKVKLPVATFPDTPGTFKFVKPSSVSVVGSYGVGCSLGPNIKLDVRVEIPESCFDEKDYLNHRYHRKRALYLAYIAGKLRGSELVEEMHFLQASGNPLKPILELKPSGKLGKRFLVVLHLSLSSSLFKLSRFSPARNNVRPHWFFEENEPVQEGALTPTSHYNSSISRDLVMDTNDQYFAKTLENHPHVRDGILLLKVWLKQRQLNQGYGCFSGYIMSMYVLYLLKTRHINSKMSSYQVARVTWNNIAKSDWTKNGISLASAPQQPTLTEFHEQFDVVFVDVTGFCNICADMSKETFLWVKQECDLAIKCLDNPNINSFQALFMTVMPFYCQFDHILRLSDSNVIKSLVEKHGDRANKLDYMGHTFPQALNLILRTLHRGLQQRVLYMGIRFPEIHRWPVNEAAPLGNETIVLGMYLNPDFAFSVLEKGPGANLPEAFEFREFWGSKSEVRRFQDGSISETVVWCKNNATLKKKRLICQQIVTHLLSEKFGITTDCNLVYVADQLEPLLEQQVVVPAGFEYGTGEEAAVHVIGALDDLGKELRLVQDIPLNVIGVQGTSSVFRYSDVFPPLATSLKTFRHAKTRQNSFLPQMKGGVPIIPQWIPPIEAVIQLGMSGKWPQDPNAILRIKAAFYLKIAEGLRKQFHLAAQSYPDCIDVVKNGFVFRLILAHQQEVARLKETKTPEGIRRYRDTPESLALEKKIVHLPKLTSALHGLHQQHSAYGPTCCLAKRWLSSQLLDPHHFPEMCVELLVASFFLTPDPFRPPNQPQLGFLCFLHLVANTNWHIEPVILDLNTEMNREDILEIETWFHKNRSTLPALFISTPYDKKASLWSKDAPTLQILIRVAMLAREALKIVEGLTFSRRVDCKQIFRPPLDPYDVIIHLIPALNPRSHEAVDAVPEKKLLSEYVKKRSEKVPVVGFSPALCFLQKLRDNYSDYALFFYDIYGGDFITMLWKPAVLQTKVFKVSAINCHKPKDSQIELNVDGIISDIYTLGSGLVQSVDVKRRNS